MKRTPGDKRFWIRMLETKAGYMDGERHEFEADEVYEVDSTLFKAFVVDLEIAERVDPKTAKPAGDASAAADGAADANGEKKKAAPAKSRGRGK